MVNAATCDHAAGTQTPTRGGEGGPPRAAGPAAAESATPEPHTRSHVLRAPPAAPTARAPPRSPKWSSGKLPLSGGLGWKLLEPKFIAVDMTTLRSPQHDARRT